MKDVAEQAVMARFELQDDPVALREAIKVLAQQVVDLEAAAESRDQRIWELEELLGEWLTLR